MGRKQKFSNNLRKAEARVQYIHARIVHARMDFRHQTSSTISKNHVMVCMEDLQVLNWVKSTCEIRAEQGETRSEVVRVSPPTEVKNGVEWWTIETQTTAKYEPNLSGVQSRINKE